MSNFQVNPNFSEVNLNYSADERQAKMAAMMARMREPEYRTDVDVADAVIERVAVAAMLMATIHPSKVQKRMWRIPNKSLQMRRLNIVGCVGIL